MSENWLPEPLQRLDQPLYGYAEADRIAGATRGTSKRWLRGYRYVGPDGATVTRPAVTPAPSDSQPGVSFFDLIEVAAIGRLKDVGWSLPSIRAIVQNCQYLFQVPRPLITLRFKTDGREIFVARGHSLVDVGVSRQRGRQAWDEVLAPFLTTIEYEGDFARRWWPLGQERSVVVDPDYGFGLPVIAGSGVRTEVVLEQFQAGMSQSRIAHDFNISLLEVEQALQYETRAIARSA